MEHERQGSEELEHNTVSEIRGAPSTEWAIEVSDGKAPRRMTLSEGHTLLFGSSARVDIRLEDPAVSGCHGEISVQDGQLWIRDAGSRNGVYVAGARVPQASFQQPGSFVLGRSLVQVAPGVAEIEDVAHEPPLEGVVGLSLAMRRLARDVRRFAPMRAPVLIRGETGVGKELIAEALHRHSGRARGPFLPMNMGALPPELVDSELFGHEKGAFTGAVNTSLGAFVAAQNGTIFLDEVAELPLGAQAKLLRTLENGEVKPVGAAQPRKINARVVSASWASLPERALQGRFREDLYHRLAVLTIQVPPLRDRFGDLPLLVRFFLDQMAHEIGECSLSSGALSRIASHGWPGNVRELRNVLLRAALLAQEGRIGTSQIEEALCPFRQPLPVDELKRALEARRMLALHQGNTSSAARAMGVPRSTFRGWLRRVSEP
ncbi:MAG: sigma 54-interacting transcriptional regulator [Polyangiaceae bacterium]|jgi:DNA-binding NtrC family response regulator|nr:sigma 54-interacting transcriptional regulator [Polyangiaceae bacterium]